MTLRHRRWHFWIWLLLAPALGVGLLLSWNSRPKPQDERSESWGLKASASE